MTTTNFKLGSECFHFKEELIHDKVECKLNSLTSGKTLTWHHPPCSVSITHPRFHPLAYLLDAPQIQSMRNELRLKLACEGIGLGFEFEPDFNPRMSASTDKLVTTYRHREELSGWTFERLSTRYWVTAPGCLEDYLPFENLHAIISFLAVSSYSTPSKLRLEVLASYWREPLSSVILYAQMRQEVVLQRPSYLQALNVYEKLWLRGMLEGKELTHETRRGFDVLNA